MTVVIFDSQNWKEEKLKKQRNEMRGESSKCKPRAVAYVKFLTLQWRDCQSQTLRESWNFILDSSVDSLTTEKREEEKITLPYELPSECTIAAFILLAFWPFPSLVSFLFPISSIRVSTEMATKQTLLLLANSLF